MKKIKEQILDLGLNVKKEILFYGLLCLGFLTIFAVTVIFLGLSYYVLLPLMAWVFASYLYANRYARLILKRQRKRMDEFVTLFTFFGIYIEDGFTVFHALEECRNFASDDMKRLFDSLLEEIDLNKSVEPYDRFASHFPDIAVKQVMVSIYQMVNEGQGGVYIRQFNHLFQKLSDQKYAFEKERRNERLQTLSFLPLAGSAISMITLSLTLLTVMEESMNVL